MSGRGGAKAQLPSYAPGNHEVPVTPSYTEPYAMALGPGHPSTLQDANDPSS